MLIGGDGTTLTGGKGPDVFLFGPGDFGSNVITDFEAGLDAIQFDDAIFATAAEVFANTTSAASGMLIDDGDGNTVALLGVTFAQMQSNPSDYFLV